LSAAVGKKNAERKRPFDQGSRNCTGREGPRIRKVSTVNNSEGTVTQKKLWVVPTFSQKAPTGGDRVGVAVDHPVGQRAEKRDPCRGNAGVVNIDGEAAQGPALSNPDRKKKRARTIGGADRS